MAEKLRHVMECESCDEKFDPCLSLWRCPACDWKVIWSPLVLDDAERYL